MKPHKANANHMSNLKQITQVYLITGKSLKHPLQENEMNGIK